MKTATKPTETLSRLALYAVISLAVVVSVLYILSGCALPVVSDVSCPYYSECIILV